MALSITLAVLVPTLFACSSGSFGRDGRPGRDGRADVGAASVSHDGYADSAEPWGAPVDDRAGELGGVVDPSGWPGAGRRYGVDERELESARAMVRTLRERGLSAHASARGVVVTLPDVLFQFGSVRLTGEARRKIQEVADVLLAEGRGRRIAVEGHTDSIGADLYNQGLAERRAERVSAALVSSGIQDALVSQKGYGSTFPIAPNTNADGSDNPAGRARNRRVEIVVLN